MTLLGTLIAVVIGGATGILAILLHANYRNFHLRKAIAGSLASEIEGLVRAVERRNYLGGLDALLSEHEAARRSAAEGTAPTPQRKPIKIRVPVFGPRISFNYFAVFDKTCDRVGLLGETAGEVSLLYALAKGIAEDMNLLREGTQFQTLDEVIQFHQELRNILAEEIERGKNLIPRLRAFEDERFFHLLK